jgi:protein-S-isoprenylcysteine O-methyltransferase Ste14
MVENMRAGISRVARITKIVSAFVFVLCFFFIPAGTLAWPEAWILICLYTLAVGAAVIWLGKYDPGLLKERSKRKNDGKPWDKVLLSVYTVLLLCMIVLCGLDAVRFEWTSMPLLVKVSGFLLFIPAGLLVFTAMKENTFLSEVVRIQTDREHHVIKKGPYGIIRHPMYAGVILFIIAIPVALGSLSGLIVSGLIAVLFVVRTQIEDRTLQRELPGYTEYTNEVRYRLLPWVW